MPEQYQLTPVEHELMEILWLIKEGTVHDVMAYLPKNRNLAYTSVSTMLRILQHKKILTIQKTGRKHIYQPTLTKESYAAHSIKKMVKQVFSGNSVNLIAHLVKTGISLAEINAIQELLDNKKKEFTK
jgi:predicted transcriptional regulator